MRQIAGQLHEMKIHVLSDLHLEFGPITLPRVDADLVVLAGDVHTKRNGIPWIRRTFPEVPVIYIVGNHEFYGEKAPGLLDKLKSETGGSNIRVLENEFVEIGGYRIFGATLWSDLALFGDPQTGSIEALAMNDYKRIHHSVTYRKLRPVDTRVSHLDSVRAIESFLATGDPRRSVVVTHHAPSVHSLPPDPHSGSGQLRLRLSPGSFDPKDKATDLDPRAHPSFAGLRGWGNEDHRQPAGVCRQSKRRLQPGVGHRALARKDSGPQRVPQGPYESEILPSPPPWKSGKARPS